MMTEKEEFEELDKILINVGYDVVGTFLHRRHANWKWKYGMSFAGVSSRGVGWTSPPGTITITGTCIAIGGGVTTVTGNVKFNCVLWDDL